jgi:hypothetical protein
MTVAVKHFDVHDYIKNAKKFGVREDLAEFQAREIQKAIQEAVTSLENKELAKKSDLIASELRLIKWVVGVGISAVILLSGVIFTLLKLMIN